MTASLRFSGAVALVTGASRGIGAGIAQRLARDGARVAVNFRENAEAAAAIVASIEAEGGEAITVQADVGDVRQATPLVDAVMQRWGRLDVLVNNAAAGRMVSADTLTEADFDWHFAANVKSVLFVSQAAAAVFGPEGGAIVNISSLNTRYPGLTPLYSATKAAVESITVSHARHWGPRGIRVNAVAPGGTETDMLRANHSPDQLREAAQRITLGRLGQPSDIADVVSFLASAEARWITGETLHVNGGQRP